MKRIKRILHLFAITTMFLLPVHFAFATHNRAGEITYVQKGEYTYEITLVTYTYTKAIADRPELDIYFGDGTSSLVPRANGFGDLLPDNYKKNIYIVTHTFPGPGTYTIFMQDQNRNEGVLNIPNSVNVVFAVKTVLQINPFIGANNTPVMLNPPIDKAARGKVFIHNPNAYDPDGDSLSYKITVCLGDNGKPISNYSYPTAKNELKVDPITGDFIWNYPEILGIYNVAMEIEEWRSGVKIGSIIRDMQIEVIETDNNPPVIDSLDNFCVTADSTIQFTVTASDAADEHVTLSSTGGVYLLDSNPASFPPATALHTVSSDFTWHTNCSHVRKRPYLVIFKATDDNPEQVLSSYRNVDITVVSPGPENVLLEATNGAIFIKWDPLKCEQAIGYKIYRKKMRTGFEPANCETGVPDYLDYEFIGKVEGWNNTEYLDNDNGNGLVQGFEYCYLIVAYFEDGAESYASEEVCSEMLRGVPIIIQTSVSTTDAEHGAIHLDWMEPIDFDSITIPGPYRYVIYPSNDLYGKAFTDPFYVNGLHNTFFVDTNYNTLEKPRIYKMGLYNYNGTDWDQIGVASRAASLFLTLVPGDNEIELKIGENVPWDNYEYQIYRKDPSASDFELVATTNTTSYTDKNLTNGNTYCYKVKSLGQYGLDTLPKPLINFSQEACAIPIDTFPPCPPVITLINNCDSIPLSNKLVWTNPNHSCANDVIKYKIYYKNDLQADYNLLTTIDDPNDTIFWHIPEKTLAGCYIVTAIDSFENESSKSNVICADNCNYYKLPNTFSPDGNDLNDLYKPLPYQLVEKVDIKIYSRWGALVFQTTDPDINWDGKNMITKQPVPAGVYYYVCDVWEQRLYGLEVRNLTGFIHVFTGGSGSVGK